MMGEKSIVLDGRYRFAPQIALESYQEDNKVALKAHWEDDGLIVSWHEIGEPMRVETSLRFDNDKVAAIVKYFPQNRISHLEGTRVNE